MEKKSILSKEVALKKMERMALEIAEEMFGEKEPLYIIGISGSGMVIAEQMFILLKPLLSLPVELLSCQLNKRNPGVITLSAMPDFNGKNVLLADDVTNSGRTLLYAIKPLLDFHPKKIQTLVLVERMHKSFPVNINYTGFSVATTLQDHILVEVQDGEVSGAYIM